MFEADGFSIFCNTLFIGLTAYYALYLITAAWRLRIALAGDDPRMKMLRVFISYQLLTIRIRPLLGELVQIAFWSVVILLLWWAHWQL